MTDDVWQAVIADMQARHATGLERYGKPVRAADPEDWGRHLAEELLDALVYLKALRLRLTWTTDLPTVPGCYWRRSLRHPEETDCLRVFDHAGTLSLWDECNSQFFPLPRAAWAWAGPLPEPADPAGGFPPPGGQ